jgi:hypothetical protein
MIPQTIPGMVWLFFKMLTLLGIAVYVVFAGVMVRQEHLMANVLEEGFEPVLRLLTYIHLVAGLAVFFLALVIL